jgi:Na+-transporting methylmalonyl-CoA/oxaloacetate decarboxylase gamma subunit
MTTLLNQALILTLVGMGMTFAALGLLVLGMYAMTALITDEPRRKTAPAEESPAEERIVTQAADVVLHLTAAARRPSAEVSANRELAAAAAVTLALALEEGRPQRDDRYRAAAVAVAMALASGGAAVASTNVVAMPDAWNTHVRSQHLTQRQRWVSRQ